MGILNPKGKSPMKAKGAPAPKPADKPGDGAGNAHENQRHENQRHEDRRDEIRSGITSKTDGKTHGRIRDGLDLVKDMRKSHKSGNR